jgi:hypothetical protein
MKHEADIALALSEQGEKFFQSEAADHPDLAEVIAEASGYTHDGNVLRYWENVDLSGEFEQFIDYVTKFNPCDTDYHLVVVSQHGDGWESGNFTDPFELRLHERPEYEIEFDPVGKYNTPPSAKAESGNTSPPILFPMVFSVQIHPENTKEPASLQEALDGISSEAMASVSGYLKRNPEITEFAAKPGNQGKGLMIRVFIRVEPVAAETSEAGGSQS